MRKIKILAIAPYTGLRDLILETAKSRNDIEVEAYVADMLDGVELVKSIKDHDDFDCIISRAGTAELLREITNIPVIDIKISIIDMISAMNLAQNYNGSFVIVGFRSITENAEIIKQLNDYSIDVITVNEHLEIDNYLIELKNRGVSLIVGDVITVSKAKKLGLNTILVTSGKESVLNSFDEVINLIKLLSFYEQKNSLLDQIVNQNKSKIIAFNQDKKMVYTNIKDNYPLFLENAIELIDELLTNKTYKSIKPIEDNLMMIRGEVILIDNQEFTTFYFDKSNKVVKLNDPAISYRNAYDEANTNLETISTNNEKMKSILENVKSFSKLINPTLIAGETGTGKDTLAYSIYKQGTFHHNPLIIIDVKYMNEKKWIDLFESDNSFLTDSEITIYMKNVHLINEESANVFETYFANTYIHKRIKFIFSYVYGYSDSFDNGSLLSFIRNDLGANSLILPNLNDRKEDISSLSSLFISEIILKYGKQIIGLEPNALQLLQEFNWSQHLNQLKRVIEECIILTDSFYINEHTVQKVLSNETIPETESYGYLDLHKTLDEINQDLIQLVLSQENFNQSKAAKRLGISRSTLWRKLK